MRRVDASRSRSSARWSRISRRRGRSPGRRRVPGPAGLPARSRGRGSRSPRRRAAESRRQLGDALPLRGYIVAGIDARVSDRSIDVSIRGENGAPGRAGGDHRPRGAVHGGLHGRRRASRRPSGRSSAASRRRAAGSRADLRPAGRRRSRPASRSTGGCSSGGSSRVSRRVVAPLPCGRAPARRAARVRLPDRRRAGLDAARRRAVRRTTPGGRSRRSARWRRPCRRRSASSSSCTRSARRLAR